MKCLLVYVRSAHKQAYKELDKPLYKDFVNDAIGALADIRLDEITTENTFRMEVHNEIRSTGYPRYDNAVNNKLTILDFMGITEVEAEGGIPVLENVDSVGWFKYMFRMDYEAQGFSRAEVREILKEYVSLGEFDHKGYHPVKGFVSGVLDVTIVKPAIEGIFKTVFKTWAIDALSDTAAYKEVKTLTAEETNQWFIDNVKPDYKPPYKPGTVVKEIELTENTTFVRVYDNMPDGSGMYGSWIMKAEDIEGLTPLEIQNKFALPNTPKYVCDVGLEVGTHIRVGD